MSMFNRRLVLGFSLFSFFVIVAYIVYQSENTSKDPKLLPFHSLTTLTTNDVSQVDFKTIDLQENQSKVFQPIKSTNSDRSRDDFKTILMWNNPAAAIWSRFDGTSAWFELLGCQEKRCLATNQRSFLPSVDLIDAIIFQHPKFNASDLPDIRSPHQRYVFYSMESPNYYQVQDSEADEFYNWTMTYKRDSDFVKPYGKIVFEQKPPEGEELRRYIEDFGQKNKHLARRLQADPPLAWVVSNCESESNREHLVQSIKSLINIKIYGGCGDFECQDWRNHHECMLQLEKEHKFYLSLENCEDYITEKFFKVLDHAMIPIVLGGGNYSDFAPPKSYINVLDFDTVMDLVDYLEMLQEDHAKFAEYFWWRDFYKVRDTILDNEQAFCDLCQRLHSSDEGPKVLGSELKDWWNGNCTRLKQMSLIEERKIEIESL